MEITLHPKFSRMQSRKYLQASRDARISLMISSFLEKVTRNIKQRRSNKHDENLRGVLKRLHQHDVRLNKEKCSFSKSEIKCYGHIFSSEGVKADPDKTQAITNMSKPESASKVRSLLGMTQYVSCYSPDYATITTPLRLLTRKETPWQWTDMLQRAFENLKDSLTENHVMSYFDSGLETEVIV